jgi:hypothetical protein
MANKFTAALLGFLLSSTAFPCSPDGATGFVPENDLYIPKNLKNRFGGLSEEQFNMAIDRVESIYTQIVADAGGKLIIERNWEDGTVNAYAQQSGKNWKVSMFGGLARHHTITEDGMSLVVCHEIGHHVGGAPKKIGWWGEGSSWASNEGQADYFATLKCLRKTFINDNNIEIVQKMNVPEIVKANCKKVTQNNSEDTAICIRTSMAGKSVSDLFSELGKLPETKFDTPDPRIVARTDDNHPKAQCRLDTYYQGSLCDISMNEDVSQKDEVTGTCHSSTGYSQGVRPLCWFKPSK